MTGKEFQEWLRRNSTNCPYVAVTLNLGLDTVRRWKANGTPDKHAEWFKRHDQEATTAPTPPEKNLAAEIPVTKQEATRQGGYRDVFVGTQTDSELYERGCEYLAGFDILQITSQPYLRLGLFSLGDLLKERCADVTSSLECLNDRKGNDSSVEIDILLAEAADVALYAAMIAAACRNMLAEEEV